MIPWRNMWLPAQVIYLRGRGKLSRLPADQSGYSTLTGRTLPYGTAAPIRGGRFARDACPGFSRLHSRVNTSIADRERFCGARGMVGSSMYERGSHGLIRHAHEYAAIMLTLSPEVL